jgi:alcohol dehydrogenase class IV
MTIGAYLAGLAFNQTRTTVCHAISYDLTGRFGIEHGIACALTLVPFLRFNREAIAGKLGLIGDVCGYGGAEGFLRAVETLHRTLRLPAKLSEYTIRGEDVDSIADAALQVPSIRLNPRRIAREELVGILNSIV